MSYLSSALRQRIIALPAKVTIESLNVVSELLGQVEVVMEQKTCSLREEFSLRFPEFNSYILDSVLYARLVIAFLPFIAEKTNEKCTLFPFGTIFSPTMSLILPTILAKDPPFTSQKCSPERCSTLSEDILFLKEDKDVLFSLIKGMMKEVAPNLSALVGEDVGACLLGACGNSLKRFSFNTGNDVIGLGRNTAAGGGAGILSTSDIVTRTPEQWKMQATRLMACKAVLAARMDLQSNRGDGSGYGAGLREEVIRKLEKMQEPAKLNLQKPIPPPQVQSSKKRGGRRQRKLKEMQGSAGRRKANRIDFNTPMDYVDDVI